MDNIIINKIADDVLAWIDNASDEELFKALESVDGVISYAIEGIIA